MDIHIKVKEGMWVVGYADGSEMIVNEKPTESEGVETYQLSANQARFINEAEKEGVDVDYWYSGRGMYGKYCPAVRTGRYDDEFVTRAKVRRDSMGLGSVVYTQY